MTEPTSTDTVLVVGATGNLGGKVVDALLDRGKPVRALVRPDSDASRLKAKGVGIARGDMLDLDSLVAAMTGVDAVITTAAGYTRGGKNATDIDTLGNSNLAEAAHRTGIRRFVLTSILTSDQTPGVPHFWHKKLTEDRLASLNVPFVALRPGAFLEQVTQLGGNAFAKRRLTWIGNPATQLTFILMTDLASNLAAAVDAAIVDGERIDIGWDRPLSINDVAAIASDLLHTRITVRAIPLWVLGSLTATVGRFRPVVADMTAMLRWFQTGRYVADTTRQTEVFGSVPSADNAIRGLITTSDPSTCMTLRPS